MSVLVFSCYDYGTVPRVTDVTTVTKSKMAQTSPGLGVDLWCLLGLKNLFAVADSNSVNSSRAISIALTFFFSHPPLPRGLAKARTFGESKV